MHDRCTDFSHSDKFLHSAGYDAYATGLIFLKMAGLVSELGDGESVDISSENLAKVANKLHLMRSDIPFVHIDGEDGKSDSW